MVASRVRMDCEYVDMNQGWKSNRMSAASFTTEARRVRPKGVPVGKERFFTKSKRGIR